MFLVAVAFGLAAAQALVEFPPDLLTRKMRIDVGIAFAGKPVAKFVQRSGSLRKLECTFYDADTLHEAVA